MIKKRYKVQETQKHDFIDTIDEKGYCYGEGIDLLNKLNNKNEELKLKLKESNSDKKYIRRIIEDRIKNYHSYPCINKTDTNNGCIGLKMELEDFYNDVKIYLEELNN